jgi:phospholipid/cholesterol/gamma-HCH transport system substrate-binding protein
VDFIVGIFVLLALAAFVVLAFRVSGLVHLGNSGTYEVSADFDNIGGLEARAAVRIAGVDIGTVESIDLNPKTFRAHVIIRLQDKYNVIPTDSSAGIYTQGILGANYVNISPGFDNTMLKNGGVIATTQSAMILENLIGQLLFSMKGNDKDDDSDSTASNNTVKSTKAETANKKTGEVSEPEDSGITTIG